MAKKQIGEVDYNVEFNDSVLSTKTWNNPRYVGCQTKTQNINEFTTGDITYGKTASTQKYTRNIYVGQTITSTSGSQEDPLLIPFNGFSYLSTTQYLTINSDDSIDEIIYDSSIIDNKKGFYRSFNEDFTPGTKCKVRLLDNNITSNLKNNHNVYFSDGRLRKIAHFRNLDQENSNNGIWAPSGDNLIVFAEDITDTFVSFSIYPTEDNPYKGPYGDPDLTEGPPYPFKTTTGSIVQSFFEATAASFQESNENRYFFTLTQGPNFPFTTASIGTSLNTPILANTGSEITPKLSQLSTVEYFTLREIFNVRYVNIADKYKLEKPFFDDAYGDLGSYPYGDAYYMGYYISKLDSDIPSILVDLDKESELPNGLVPGNVVNTDGTINFEALPGFSGPKFVIIPDNLHPYIKDNINYFLNQAGLLDSNQPLTINPRNRQLS